MIDDNLMCPYCYHIYDTYDAFCIFECGDEEKIIIDCEICRKEFIAIISTVASFSSEKCEELK